MRSARSRLAVLASLVLALTVVGGAPAQADPVGTLRVNLVDQGGQPVLGLIYEVTPSNLPGGQGMAVSSKDFSVVPGTYAAVGITPWGGMMCAGLTSCLAFGGGPAELTGDVVVVAGQVAEVTLTEGPPATVVGTGAVGSPLEVALSPQMKDWLKLLLTTNPTFGPTVQWQRGGEDIAGAVGDTYTPTFDDLGSTVSAVLSYPTAAQPYLPSSFGTVVPVAVPGVEVTRSPTSTVIKLARTVRAGDATVARVVATATGSVVLGKATIRIGSWQSTRSLRHGTARFRLPHLAPGKYQVTASYAGSSAYASSTAKPRSLTVKK